MESEAENQNTSRLRGELVPSNGVCLLMDPHSWLHSRVQPALAGSAVLDPSAGSTLDFLCRAKG